MIYYGEKGLYFLVLWFFVDFFDLFLLIFIRSGCIVFVINIFGL